MTFTDCLMTCAGETELVVQFDRLNGTSLSKLGQRCPIDRMVDEATGAQDDQMRQFVAFVMVYVWMPLIGIGET